MHNCTTLQLRVIGPRSSLHDDGPLSGAMIEENQQLVANEPVEFEKLAVDVQDCRRIADRFRGIYRTIYPNLVKENRRMSTCNRLDLQTLGSQPITGPGRLLDIIGRNPRVSKCSRLHVGIVRLFSANLRGIFHRFLKNDG